MHFLHVEPGPLAVPGHHSKNGRDEHKVVHGAMDRLKVTCTARGSLILNNSSFIWCHIWGYGCFENIPYHHQWKPEKTRH